MQNSINFFFCNLSYLEKIQLPWVCVSISLLIVWSECRAWVFTTRNLLLPRTLALSIIELLSISIPSFCQVMSAAGREPTLHTRLALEPGIRRQFIIPSCIRAGFVTENILWDSTKLIFSKSCCNSLMHSVAFKTQHLVQVVFVEFINNNKQTTV